MPRPAIEEYLFWPKQAVARTLDRAGRPGMRRFPFLAAAVAVLMLSACDSDPRAEAEALLRDMERQEPVLALLRAHEPQARAEMRALIEQHLQAPGPPDRDALILDMRAIMIRTATKRLKTVPDQLAVDYARFISDKLHRLTPQPEVCAGVLRNTVVNVTQHTSPLEYRREQRLNAALISAPINPQLPVASEDDLAAFRADFLIEATRTLSLSEAQVLIALDATGPPREICRVAALLMRRVSLLPPDQAGRLYRLFAKVEEEMRQNEAPGP